MAFGPGRKAPIAAANQHCRQKSATPSCVGAAAARRVQSRCSSLPSSSATHSSGRSQVQGRSVELRKCGSPVCREGVEMQEGQEKMQKSVSMVQLHVCGGAAACVRRRSPAQQATHSPWRNQRAGWPPWQRQESCSCCGHCCRWSHCELQVVHPRQ